MGSSRRRGLRKRQAQITELLTGLSERKALGGRGFRHERDRIRFMNTEMGCHFLSSGDLPDPGIKPTSPALQADSLPSEPSRKPHE